MITEIYIQYSGHYGSINAFNPRDPGINPIQKQVKVRFKSIYDWCIITAETHNLNRIYSFGMF